MKRSFRIALTCVQKRRQMHFYSDPFRPPACNARQHSSCKTRHGHADSANLTTHRSREPDPTCQQTCEPLRHTSGARALSCIDFIISELRFLRQDIRILNPPSILASKKYVVFRWIPWLSPRICQKRNPKGAKGGAPGCEPIEPCFCRCISWLLWGRRLWVSHSLGLFLRLC